MIQLPDLSAAIGQTIGDPRRAATIAENAVGDLSRHGQTFNTFIGVDRKPAPKPDRVKDSLLGCVFSVKDNIDVAGLVTTCGSRVFKDAPPASKDSWIVAALRDAGAQCIGKNNMHEFALGDTGENPVFGTTANPWDQTRNCGGSSGGSASAVALRQVHLAIGTDSGGSVRVPAGFTGIVGFKPTPGTLPLAGVSGAAWTIDNLGLFTATVTDLSIIWDAIVGPAIPAKPKYLRLGYLADDSMGLVEPEVWARYLGAIEMLRNAGVKMVGISMEGFADGPFICMSIAYPEIASLHYELLRDRPDLYDPNIRGLISLGDIWSSRVYLDAQRMRTVFSRRFADVLAPFDAIVTPTAAVQPPKIGSPARVAADALEKAAYTNQRFTVLFNIIGYPALSLPSGFDGDGLPTAVQIIGRPGADGGLLDIALGVEEIFGVMPPPVVP